MKSNINLILCSDVWHHQLPLMAYGETTFDIEILGVCTYINLRSMPDLLPSQNHVYTKQGIQLEITRNHI